jgi:hypothetical protein
MIPATLSPESAALLLERRRERSQALRACRPIERVFLKQLPKSRYSPYVAGKALGYSDSTTWKIMQRGRVKHAMELFLRDALEEIGVSHTSLVADLVAIKERCMQVCPVLDKEGKPTGEFQFDSRGAIAAIKEIAELLKIAPAKRVEISNPDGIGLFAPLTRAVATALQDITDPNEAALQYQQLMYGKTTLEPPTSLN